MSHETDLRTAIAYLDDLDAEIEERSTLRGVRAHAAACDDMLRQLNQSRRLVASLERQGSNVSCICDRNGREALFDLHKVRTWCQAVEAGIARICCDEGAAAAA